MPVFLAPSAIAQEHYNSLFKLLMALCGVAAIAAVALALDSAGAGRGRLARALGIAVVAPVALGPVFLNAYDPWPALLTVAALAALLRGRSLTAFGLLGLAISAKVFPLAVLPVAAVRVWRREGPRALARAAAVLVGAGVAVSGFFATAAPGGVGDGLYVQAKRGLQVESLGAAVLLAADRVGAYGAKVVVGSPGSMDLAGTAARAVAALTSAAEILAVLAVAALYARRRDDDDGLIAAFAAATVAFVAFGKVLSPQYLVWLVPLVPLVAARAGLAASGLLLAALAMTHGWFFHQKEVFAVGGIVWLVLARDLVLVALYALLLRALARTRTA